MAGKWLSLRRAERTPRVLWVELTSTCPFDCVFCSRKTLRGKGRHMDFGLYEAVVRDLDQPEIIRLNYSGESLFYPRLAEAVQLAAGTGASTELVSAFIGASEDAIRRLVLSGLDRLTVSLHAMTPGIYRETYGCGSPDDLRVCVDTFLRVREKEKMSTPRLDFAFVAMRRNVGELEKVAAYAREVGSDELSVHPVIGRDPIPARFDEELEGGRLTANFKAELHRAIGTAREKHPGLQISVSTTELDDTPRLCGTPAYFPGQIPPGARVHTCDQNPWETIHILAGGEAVTCECRDGRVVGTLTPEDGSLQRLWHGVEYQDFRGRYHRGESAECRACPYKMAYLPGPVASAVAGGGRASPQLLSGWYTGQPETGVAWSKKRASVLVRRPAGWGRVRVRGILPHSARGAANELTVSVGGKLLGRVTNRTDKFMSFDESFRLNLGFFQRFVVVDLETGSLFRPSRDGGGGDGRSLGVALMKLEIDR